jgi:hypothetical protein
LGEEGRVKHRGPEIFSDGIKQAMEKGGGKEAKKQKEQKREQVPMKRIFFFFLSKGSFL